VAGTEPKAATADDPPDSDAAAAADSGREKLDERSVGGEERGRADVKATKLVAESDARRTGTPALARADTEAPATGLPLLLASLLVSWPAAAAMAALVAEMEAAAADAAVSSVALLLRVWLPGGVVGIERVPVGAARAAMGKPSRCVSNSSPPPRSASAGINVGAGTACSTAFMLCLRCARAAAWEGEGAAPAAVTKPLALALLLLAGDPSAAAELSTAAVDAEVSSAEEDVTLLCEECTCLGDEDSALASVQERPPAAADVAASSRHVSSSA